MYETFKRFTSESLFAARGADPYLQSHPMPAERVAALEELARASPYWDKKDDPALQLRHDMIRAKISAFMERQDTVYRRYPLSNDSTAGTLCAGDHDLSARRPAQRADPDRRLIQQQPNNAYFYELRGQALLEGGKPTEAIAPLRKAVQLSSSAPLIEMLLGQALVATENKAYTDEAVHHPARRGGSRIGSAAWLHPARHGLWPEGRLRGGRSGVRAGRLPPWRQQDRSRARLARKNPFRDRHARMGQGR